MVEASLYNLKARAGPICGFGGGGVRAIACSTSNNAKRGHSFAMHSPKKKPQQPVKDILSHYPKGPTFFGSPRVFGAGVPKHALLKSSFVRKIGNTRTQLSDGRLEKIFFLSCYAVGRGFNGLPICQTGCGGGGGFSGANWTRARL